MEVKIHGKVVVITGATSGIGRIAVERLAAMGARLVLVARDKGRAEETLAQLSAPDPGVTHRAHYADLSRLADVKRVGAEIAAVEPRVDVLINNAGGLFSKREITEDGLERTFATNHIAYFVLTHCLWERLLAAAPARVIITASEAHRRQRLDFSDLQMLSNYGALTAYGRSKLCNILFNHELARRLGNTGVTANCLHPGFVTTNLGQRGGGLFGVMVRVAMLFAGRPETGADTIVHLASSSDVAEVSGGYFYACRQITPSREALDDISAELLWQETARLTGTASIPS